MGGLCQVPKIMYTIPMPLMLIVIIVIMTTERLFECICLLSRMLQNPRLCVLLQGFTNFSVNPYYDPLSLVMIELNLVETNSLGFSFELHIYERLKSTSHVNNTLVCHISFLAAAAQKCGLIYINTEVNT